MDRVEIFYQLFISPAGAHTLEQDMVRAALSVAHQADPGAQCTIRHVRRATDPANLARTRLFRRSDAAATLIQQWVQEHPDQPVGSRAVFTVSATIEGNGVAAQRGEMYWAVLDTVCPHARSQETAYEQGQHVAAIPDEIPWAGGVYVVQRQELDERLAVGV